MLLDSVYTTFRAGFNMVPIIIAIISFLIVVAPIVIILIIAVNHKKIGKAGDEIASSIKKTLSFKNKQDRCEYCGSVIDEDINKCKNCGAPKQS